ncbi:MAG TPA: amidohydrolase family protein, partial [Pyrinomonadaceae bacterium]
ARLPYTFTRYLCSGVTSVVDVGGPMWNFKVREIAARTEEAPRVAVAGPLISTYAPEKLKTDDPAIIKAGTPEEARALAERELAQKPDLVKIWFIRTGTAKLEDLVPVVKAAVEAAHARGVRVAVHATELETAKAAVRAGCDILVHSVQDLPVDDEFIRLVKERNVIYTTTLIVYEGYTEVGTQNVELTDVERACGDPQVIASWNDLAKFTKQQPARRPAPEKVMLENLKRVQDAGIVVAAGTDAGNIGTLHGPSLHREFELMAQAGLTPMQIIVAATQNAARVFSPRPETGTVAAGKLADLVILDENPLADIRNARKISKVIKGGRVFERAQFLTAQTK